MFDFVSFIPRAVVQGVPLMLGSTGETLTQKSGNLNLGLPGVMYVGAISGVIGAFFYEQSTPPESMNALLAIGIPLVCCLAGSLLMGLLYCFLTVTLRANQNVTGLAMTTFGVGFGNFFGGSLIKLTDSEVPSLALTATSSYFTAKLPFAESLGALGDIVFNYGFLAYLAIAICLACSFYLKRTRPGLNLRAVGEDPATADAAGIRRNALQVQGDLRRLHDSRPRRPLLRHGLRQRHLVERRLRRPRLARDCARHLHDVAPRRQHPRRHPLRRPLHPAPVPPHRH